MGDGLMVIFRSAADAVACGIAMQQAVCVVNRERDFGVGLRVGLSAGEAAEEEGDWHGTPVVEAARLCSAAAGGQVLVSDVVRALVGSRGEPSLRRALVVRPQGASRTGSRVHGVVGAADRAPDRLAARPARSCEPGRVRRPRRCGRRCRRRHEACGGDRPPDGVGERRAGPGQDAAGGRNGPPRRDRGPRVLFGRCDEDLQRAYRPWSEVAASLTAALADDALDQHLSACDGAVARLGVAVHRRRPTRRRPRRSTRNRSRSCSPTCWSTCWPAPAPEATVMIVLDDLHWADRSSLLLLKALLHATAAVPLVIVGTYRDTDLDRTHPLSSLLGDLRREPGVERLALAASTPARSPTSSTHRPVSRSARRRPSWCASARGDERQSAVSRRSAPLLRGNRRVGASRRRVATRQRRRSRRARRLEGRRRAPAGSASSARERRAAGGRGHRREPSTSRLSSMFSTPIPTR